MKTKFDLSEELSKLHKKEKSVDFQTLEGVVKKWLLIQDKGIVKVLVATVLANKICGDPVWLFIVNPSGGAKTELIRGLNKVKSIYPLSDLTPQTFISGDKGKNSSLLLRLKPNTILTYKDFTTVLTMHRDKRHAILSQLREIYDGYYRKEFGTGETKTWEGKIGFIAGVTSVIEQHHSIFQVLGERFIQYRPVQSNTIDLAKRAMTNSGNEKAMREEIQDAFASFINNVEIPQGRTPIPEALKDSVAHLSTFCAIARSGVVRDGFSSREIELIPDAEMPTRLAKQLISLVSAFSLIETFSYKDYELLYKIGMDSIPVKRKKVLSVLTAAKDELETADIAKSIGYPTNTTRRILEDLHGLRLLNRMHEGKGYPDRWVMNPSMKKIWENAYPEHFKNLENARETTTLPEISERERNSNSIGIDDTSGKVKQSLDNSQLSECPADSQTDRTDKEITVLEVLP